MYGYSQNNGSKAIFTNVQYLVIFNMNKYMIYNLFVCNYLFSDMKHFDSVV